jgi:predicted ArsR family transcriptional regulator
LKSGEATLLEVARELVVSRTTAIRWLALMESEELLSTINLMSGKKGRPKVVYRPTSKLMKVVETHSLGSIAILSFGTLKGACKHLVEESCRFRAEPQPCTEALCPLLHA